MQGLIGKKIGMTSLFTEDGRNLACTVVQTGPCVVTQVKTIETDGYSALQLGFGERKAKNVSNQLKGHLSKSGDVISQKLVEFRDFEIEKSLGDTITVDDVFQAEDIVKVSGFSKGKGFQGVVKRHNFAGVNDATHGQHNRQRSPGSIGAASYPAKVFKGMRMAGQDGNRKVTTKNLKVLRVMPENNLLLIKGTVPGHKGSIVIIEK